MIKTLTVTISTLTLPLLTLVCGSILQTSGLPKEMPGGTVMEFSENGGMSPASKQIRIEGNTMYVEKRTVQDTEEKKFSVQIPPDDVKRLYQAFYDNKFDTIKNEENKNITYDAPSEGISITCGGKFNRVSSGANDPLSARNTKRYAKVRAAFTELETKYQDSLKPAGQEYAVIKYDTKAHDYIFKNAAPAALDQSEIGRIQDLTVKAVEDYKSHVRFTTPFPDLDKFKYQYIAVINEKGEKEVWVNAFCDSFGIDWQKVLIKVKDGGNCFFNFKINLKTSAFYDFLVNGDA